MDCVRTPSQCAVALAALLLAGSVSAGSRPICHHREVPCKTCLPSVEPGEKEASCWRVECHDICIPSVKLPWEKRCKPRRPGRVVRIGKLVKQKTRRPICEYKWTILPVGPVCEEEPHVRQVPVEDSWTVPPAPR